jgi:hypothetical protein
MARSRCLGDGQTAGPFTPLRFGRDDKGKAGAVFHRLGYAAGP